MAVSSTFSPSAGTSAGALRLGGAMRSAALWRWAALLVLGASVLAAAVGPWLQGAPVLPEDDAEYYRVIARHIAQSGVSTFDGLSLTNGYHPLWEAVLVLQEKLVGSSFLVTRLIEAALVTCAFPLFLRAAGLRTALGAVGFLVLYGRLVAGLALTGMEVSALVGMTGLTVWAAMPSRRPGAPRGVLLGLAAAAAVLSRLDAAVFVAPLVAFAPLPRAVRGVALATAAAIGGVYAAYNLATFGAVLPVSSAIKSLGGVQVNARFLDQLASDWREHGPLGRYVQTFGLLALSPVFLLLSRRDSLGRALAGAALVGGVLFTAKLVFGSSWRVWPWYNFPVLFALLAAASTVGVRLEEAMARWARLRSARLRSTLSVAAPALGGLVLLALAAKAAVVVRRPEPPSLNRFDALNARAAARWGPILRGVPVAMGDRAGAFAAAYPGPVVQLEGLVNDKAWFDVVKRRGDVVPLLCARGVRFVIAYRPELGAYREHRLPVMRRSLTQFEAPAIPLAKADELDHIADRTLLDLRGVDEGDDQLYLWRLSACGAPSAR